MTLAQKLVEEIRSAIWPVIDQKTFGSPRLADLGASGQVMSKSAELRETIMQNRKKNLWQISLSRFLCGHQIFREQNFHCEQPQGSQMLKLPCFQPIIRVTKSRTFDVRRVGSLREPLSQLPIRMQLVVRTTSTNLQQNLNDRRCTEPHAHFQIAGSTNFQTVS